MSMTLRPEVEMLLEKRAKALGVDSVDQLLGYALDAFESNVFCFEELDDESWVAIEAADVSGEGIPFEQLKREWQEKILAKSLPGGGGK